LSRKGSGPGLRAEDGVSIPSCEERVLLIEFRLAVEVEFIVPVRDIDRPPIEMSASARSNTLPVKAAANEAL
jgi:hypothetical protein